MRRYKDLTKREQSIAEEKCLEQMLHAIIEGSLRFSDEKNKDTLQASIDAAISKAEGMRTPWFAHEYIMDATYTSKHDPDLALSVGENLQGMASVDAEEAFYPEPGENVIRL